MFSSIIRFSLRHKLLVLAGALVIVAWGLYSFSRLPIDAIPDITNNQVQVLTVCPTLATQEVEQFVTSPIELEVRNIPGVVELRSISRFGLSVITIVFDEDIGTYQARQMVNEKLAMAEQVIPQGFGQPELAPISTGLGEILHYRIEPLPGYEHRYTATDLRTIQDWIVKRQLTGIQGVVEVNSFGGYLKQYEIAVVPERLQALDISLGQLYEAIASSNENTGGAYIEKQTDAYFIRTEGLARSLEDIGQIVVANRGGVPVLARDVADIREGYAIRYGAVSSQASGEIVLGIVMMLKGENAGHVIQRVKDRLEQIKPSLPEGITVTPFLDREDLVDRTIVTVRNNLLEGALIVILVLVLLVGNFRAGLVIASVIPLAMLFALGLMLQTGVTANLMSLGAIDFGLIVDGAVILIEATLFYLFIHHRRSGKDVTISQVEMDESIYLASSKVARSSVFGVLIILIVYLPILALTGIEGKMFRPMALTVSYALLGALILSLTYVPVIASLVLSKKIKGENALSEKLVHGMQRTFTPFFDLALARPRVTVAIALLMLGGAVALFSTMGGEFIPTLDEGDIMMHGFCKPGTSLTQTIESHHLAQKVILDQFPDEVDQVISKIGSAEIPTDPMAPETADNIILLKPKEEWTRTKDKEELVEMIHQAVLTVPGMAFEFTQPIKMRFDEMMTGVRSDIAVKLFGDNLDTLALYGDRLARVMGNVDGARDIKVEQVLGLPQLRVRFRYDQLARYGIQVQDANQAVRIALAGEVAGQIYEDERRFDLVVRMRAQERQDAERIGLIPVRTSSGNLIPLGEIAEIREVNGAAQISREEGRRRLVISANVRGRDVESVIQDMENRIGEEIHLPSGYLITFGGQFENLVAAKQRLSVAVPLALILIGILLYVTFNSVLESALIFSAIPLASIGGVIALWMRDMPFSISAGIGFIALFGVAVLNGIVLINYLNQLEHEGMTDVLERVRKGTLLRFRPVLMTAAVASFGFIPMAFSHGAGAEVQQPLATVVIGGLVSSTLLTLLVLPALYLLFKQRQERRFRGVATITMLLIAGSLSAQVEPISEEQAVLRVVQVHPGIQAQAARVRQGEAIQDHPVPWDPVQVMHGVSADPELGLFGTSTLGAQISFPQTGRIRASRAYQRTLTQAQRLLLQQEEASRVYAARLLFLDLSRNAERQLMYRELDSLYRELVRIELLRENSGEGTPLVRHLAEGRSMQTELELHALEHEANHLSQQLAWMIGASGEVTPLVETLFRDTSLVHPDVQADTTLVARYYQMEIAASKANAAMEATRMNPSLSTGLFAQWLGDGQVFPGWNVTLSVPLFRKAYQAGVSHARIGTEVAEATYQQQLLTLHQTSAEIHHDLEVFDHELDYYRHHGLMEASEILRVTRLSLASGEIDFMTGLRAIEQAMDMRMAHIEAAYGFRRNLLHYQLITQ